MLIYVFLVLWAMNVITYLRLRFLMKISYKEMHDRVFGKTWSEHSIAYSLKFIRFSFGGEQWSQISDPKVLGILKINRVLNISIYAFVAGYMLYFIVSAIQVIGGS